MKKVELLSPAGDFETALSAFAAGADAVYCGLGEYSARAYAGNFTFKELSRLVSFARSGGKKVYVAFNTLVDEADVASAADALSRLAEIGPDALIVQDVGVASICRRHFPSLKLHASTQLVAHNLEGVLAMGDLGFERVVLARELSAAEVAAISQKCGGIELECFVHGALCYSISGLCLFSAMEKDRSGNRGRCAYCCRTAFDDGKGGKTYPFSMKDLRLGKDVAKLVDAGAVSLKIEGRMKSPLYVAAVTRYYRNILDGARPDVTLEDLETVFSRRTTELYLDGRPSGGSVIDPVSLGHVGAPVGKVKRVTKDRDGRRWVRFHTARALERHDGLQFASPGGGKPCGFGISEMRRAISRSNAFEVEAGADVEILLPEGGEHADLAKAVVPGADVYVSMSNAMKRRFPKPSFRPDDYPGTVPVSFRLAVEDKSILLEAESGGVKAESSREGVFEPAKNREKNSDAAKTALSKLGGTRYFLSSLEIENPGGLFTPVSMLNDLRRTALGLLDARLEAARREKALAAADAEMPPAIGYALPEKTFKTRFGREIPGGDWDEIVVAVSPGDDVGSLGRETRLALPVFTPEPQFSALRLFVKRALRAGFTKWEASDLATLRLLRTLGVDDITADWTLYAFNAAALAELSRLGVKRFTASPENSEPNLRFLAESGRPVEFLSRQSTPLFISLNEPAAASLGKYAAVRIGGLYVTVEREPRRFFPPAGAATVRVDESWDAP